MGPEMVKQFQELISTLAGCGKTLFVTCKRTSAAKAAMILPHLRRGYKPRPFKTQERSGFSAAC